MLHLLNPDSIKLLASSNAQACNIRELPLKNPEATEATPEEIGDHDIETGKRETDQRCGPVRELSELTVDARIGVRDHVQSRSSKNSLDETEKFDGSGSSVDTVSETKQDDIKGTTRAQLHRITNVDAYEGATLAEKIDTIIKSHPVVMIDRTWCLFSVDAQNFLLQQMKVSVHSIEVDVHPQGKEIFQYVKDKTKRNTTPCIFIRGKFLGGFKEVNALYAEGKLQELYLKDLTQADECEAVIAGAKYKTTPFFWFPEIVDGNVVRITGVLTCFASAICAFLVHYLFWARYIAYAIAVDFILRLLGGAKVSLFGRISMLAAYYLEPIPRHGRPKQFATCCGIAFSGLASLAFLVSFPGHDIVGSVYMSILAFATGMEGFLDFCVGCLVFRLCVKLGIFRGTS